MYVNACCRPMFVLEYRDRLGDTGSGDMLPWPVVLADRAKSYSLLANLSNTLQFVIKISKVLLTVYIC